jgi:hypothetical protein
MVVLWGAPMKDFLDSLVEERCTILFAETERKSEKIRKEILKQFPDEILDDILFFVASN